MKQKLFSESEEHFFPNVNTLQSHVICCMFFYTSRTTASLSTRSLESSKITKVQLYCSDQNIRKKRNYLLSNKGLIINYL